LVATFAFRTRKGHAVKQSLAKSAPIMPGRREEVFDRGLVDGVLQSSTDCIKILDLEGRVLFMNAVGLCLMDLENFEQVTGRLWVELWPIEQRAAACAALDAARSGWSHRFEAPCTTAKGMPKWWDVSLSPIMGPTNTVKRVLAISRDITEQRRTEGELRESEDRYRALISATTAIVWRAAPDGSIIEGWGNNEFAGEFLDQYSGFGWIEAVHPDDRKSTAEKSLKAFQAGTAFENIHRLRRTDGQYRWGYCRGISLRNPDGSVKEWVGTFTDIHDRHTAELALRESERRYRLLAENTGDIIIHTALDGKRLYVSSACRDILGFGPERYIGKTLLDDVHPDDVAHVASSLDDLCKGRKERETVSYSLRHKDGHWVWLEVRRRLVRDENGQPREVVSVARDMSERVRLEAQLRQSQKMEAIGHLTGGIAHDFNNLLTVILGGAELLVETDDADLRIAAQMVRDAAERGADLTQQLLAFGRRHSLKPERLKLEEVVEGMQNMLKRTIGEHIQLCTEFDSGENVALVDRALLQSAILNLVVNARDAMPRGGAITISTRAASARPGQGDLPVGQPIVTLTVADTGCGMTPDVAERAFEPFFTTKEVGKGSGLGLSMVYGFARQSGGHLELASKPGEGTTVTMALRAAQGEAAEQHSTSEWLPVLRGRGERILVVEDDAAVRRFVCAQLRRLNYDILETDDGWSALQLIEENENIDLVFTDVVLPKGLSGVEVARRAQDRRPQLKVMLTSGYSEDVFNAHGRPEGDVHLLRKPYRIQDLAQAVRSTIYETAHRRS
jgi:PAS domain S-box-containing protein